MLQNQRFPKLLIVDGNNVMARCLYSSLRYLLIKGVIPPIDRTAKELPSPLSHLALTRFRTLVRGFTKVKVPSDPASGAKSIIVFDSSDSSSYRRRMMPNYDENNRSD